MSRSERGVFWALISLTLLGRLSVALADYKSLIANDIYQDDAFYYLQIARNVVTGAGLSFDGMNPTNGFQPLYFILLLPVMWLAGDNPVVPIHLSGIMLTAWSIGTALLVFALTRRLSSVRTGLVALGMWALSPYFVVFSINGLETGPAMFFVLACVLAYSVWFPKPEQISFRRCAMFGVLGGLAILARLDLLLLLAAIGLHWLWPTHQRGSNRRRFVGGILAATMVVVTWLPWGLLSRAATGAWLPQSGRAVRTIALNYGWINLPERVWSDEESDGILFDPDETPIPYYADVATKLAAIFLFESPVLAPLRINEPFGVWSSIEAFVPFRLMRAAPVTGILIILALTVAIPLARRRLHPATDPSHASDSRGIGRIVVAYLALIAIGYTLYAPAHWYFNRYLTGPILLTGIVMLAGARNWIARGTKRSGISRVAVPVLVVILTACQVRNLAVFTSLRWSDSPAEGFLASWEKYEPRIEPDATIGAFQAGIYGYFGNRAVVNLDGKVNPAALEAIRAKRLDQYLIERDIRYVIDWRWVATCLCLRHAGPGEMPLRVIERGTDREDATLYGVGPPPNRP